MMRPARPAMAIVLGVLSTVARAAAQPTTAGAELEAALAAARQGPLTPELIEVCRQRVRAVLATARAADAGPADERIDLAREAGRAATMLADFVTAEDACRLVVDLCRTNASTDLLRLLDARVELAEALERLGKTDEVLRLSHENHRDALRHGLGPIAARNALLNVARGEIEFGDLEEGHRLVEALYAQLDGDTPWEFACTVKGLLAASASQLGDLERALPLEQSVVATLEHNGATGAPLVLALQNLGTTERMLGRLDEAIALHRRAVDALQSGGEVDPVALLDARIGLLETRATGQLGALANTGDELAAIRHELTAIIEHLDRLSLPATSPQQVSARHARAFCSFYLGDVDTGIVQLRALSAVLPPAITSFAERRQHVLQGLASFIAARRDFAEARTTMLQAIAIAEQRLQQARTLSRRARESVRRSFAGLVWSLLSCRDFDAPEADAEMDAIDLATVVRFRTSSARQALLADRISRSTDPTVARLVGDLQQAREQRRLAHELGQNAWLTSLGEAEERAERALLERIDASDLGVQPSLEALARQLPADGAAIVVVAYHRYAPLRPGVGWSPPEPRFTAFVLTRDARARRIELGKAEQVAAWVQELQTWTVDSATAAKVPTWLEPVFAAVPPDTHRLFICPDAQLAEIPWEALRLPQGGQVVDRFPRVFYGQNLDSLAARPPSPSPPRLLTIGGVDYGASAGQASTPPWRALSGTREEARTVAELFAKRHAGSESVLLTGSEASRQRVIDALPGCRYLHVATHGFARVRRAASAVPSYSLIGGLADPGAIAQREFETGLVLAGANGGSPASLLRAAEITALDLSACELAVLSACSTNVGTRQSGEAIAGLNRALHLAGVHATITSLWKVDDADAEAFFSAFYAALWGHGDSLAESFAAARAAVRERGTSAWAAFVLYSAPH